MRRISAASIPHACDAASGVNARAIAWTSSSPSTCSATSPRSVEALGDDQLQHAEEQVRVGARAG